MTTDVDTTAGMLPLDKALTFMLAGNALVTLVSKKTGARFTYKVQAPKLDKDGEPVKGQPFKWFVKVLSGPVNTTDYRYLGMIVPEGKGYRLVSTQASRIAKTAPSFLAMEWALRMLPGGEALLAVHHEGHCGRCGRLLTVPSSVALGIGPDCAAIMEGGA